MRHKSQDKRLAVAKKMPPARSKIKEIYDKEGRVDVLINNACMGIGGSIELATEEEIRLQMDTNFMGCVNMCQKVMPYMRKQIQPGRECYFSGACSLKGTEILMSQPKFLSKEQYEAECGFLAPVYPLRKDLTNTRLQKALR